MRETVAGWGNGKDCNKPLIGPQAPLVFFEFLRLKVDLEQASGLAEATWNQVKFQSLK